MNYDVVIPAAGSANRSKLGYNKILFKLKNGLSIIENAIKLFVEDEDCKSIIIVSNDILNLNSKKIKYVSGGKTRIESVLNGIDVVDSKYVLIHDGARPYLTIEDLNKLKIDILKYDASILVSPIKETVKLVKDNSIEKTLDRNVLYLAQTPQGFKTDLYKPLIKQAIKLEIEFSDDASICEHFNVCVHATIGRSDNLKFTYPEDFK